MGWHSNMLRRAGNAGLALAAAMVEAVVFAAVVGALVFWFPGKLPILVLNLYGFICVWLLQIAALLMALLMLARTAIAGTAPRDTAKAVLLCGGYIVVVALCNGYILALSHLWNKDLGTAVNDLVLSRALTTDQRIFDVAAASVAVLGDFLDHIAISALHLQQAPLAHSIALAATWIAQTSPSDQIARIIERGLAAGVMFTAWVHAARTVR